MSVDRGLQKIYVYRGDYEPYFWRMYYNDGSGDQEQNILETYDDIVIEARDKAGHEGRRLFRKTLSDGDITLPADYVFQVDLNTEGKAGKYFYDVRFKLKDEEKWLTLFSGVLVLVDNISRIDL